MFPISLTTYYYCMLLALGSSLYVWSLDPVLSFSVGHQLHDVLERGMEFHEEMYAGQALKPA